MQNWRRWRRWSRTSVSSLFHFINRTTSISDWCSNVGSNGNASMGSSTISESVEFPSSGISLFHSSITFSNVSRSLIERLHVTLTMTKLNKKNVHMYLFFFRKFFSLVSFLLLFFSTGLFSSSSFRHRNDFLWLWVIFVFYSVWLRDSLLWTIGIEISVCGYAQIIE